MLTHNTVLFDLDGTLIDPVVDVAAAVNHMCRSFNLPERTYEQIAAGMGRGLLHLLAASLPEEGGVSVEEAEKVYRRYYGDHCLDNSKPYDGIIEMLSALKNAGAKTAVISNKAHEFTAKICKTLFGDYIDVCVGEMPGLPLKPDAAPVKKALHKLGAKSIDSVYIGDTDVDMETAKNSGMHCITCAWGLRGEDFLVRNGADPKCIAKTPMDIYRMLKCEE